MNVYDCANELARAMRESHEFKKLKEANEILDKDPDTKKLVNEFLQLSQEIEIAKYQGQEPDKEKTEKLQKLYGVLGLNRDAMEYMRKNNKTLEETIDKFKQYRNLNELEERALKREIDNVLIS